MRWTDRQHDGGGKKRWKKGREEWRRWENMETVRKFLHGKCKRNWHTEARHTTALCHRSVCCHGSLCIRNDKAEVFLNSWLSCGNRTRGPVRAQTFPADTGDGGVDNLVFPNCKQTEWQTVWVRSPGKTEWGTTECLFHIFFVTLIAKGKVIQQNENTSHSFLT